MLIRILRDFVLRILVDKSLLYIFQSSEGERHDRVMIISPYGHLIDPIAGSLIYRP